MELGQHSRPLKIMEEAMEEVMELDQHSGPVEIMEEAMEEVMKAKVPHRQRRTTRTLEVREVGVKEAMRETME